MLKRTGTDPLRCCVHQTMAIKNGKASNMRSINKVTVSTPCR